MIIKIHMANKKDPAENRQDLLQIGILSLWVQYSTRNMGVPSAKRKIRQNANRFVHRG